MLKPFIVFVAVVCVAGVLHAETYHVAREAPGASDSNDGLTAVGGFNDHGPWLTVRHAAQTAIAGDTVIIHAGDYRDEPTGWGIGVIPIENSGAANAPIRFIAAAGESPILNTFLVHFQQWIEIDGITFISSDFTLPPNWQDMPAIVVDDPSVIIDRDEPWVTRELKVRQKYATYMAMHDFFTTVFTNGIDLKTAHHVTIRNCSAELYTFGIQARELCTNITIEDNYFHHCLDGVFTWEPTPAMIPAITDSVIRNNTIRQCFNSGIQVREDCERVLIEGNDIMHSGTSHVSLLAGCSDSTIRGNRGQFGGYYTETMQFPGSTSINVHTSRAGIVVEGNFAAYQIDLTYADGNGYIADLMLDGAGVLYRNNIAYRNVGSGIRTVESPNCVIVNNTLVENGWQSIEPRRQGGVHLAHETDINNVIVNNIFYGNGDAGIKSYFLMDDQLLIDHNLYLSDCDGLAGGESPPLIWDGWLFDENVYCTLDEVRTQLGWEQGGVNAEPQFFDADGLDFRLAPGSPAIDAGMPRAEVMFDFDGNPRPSGGAWDIGAFENICSPGACRGDVNCDGFVDLGDLTEVLFFFGQPCSGNACLPDACRGDLNCDGLIDLSDLSEVLFFFGQPCP